MRRILPLAAWLPAIALVGCSVAAVAAYEITPDSPPAAGGTSAEASPRYLRHEEQSVRPLRPGEYRATNDLAPRLRSTERLASGDAGETPGTPRSAGATNREIPLSPAPNDPPAGLRGNEMSALATGAASLGIVLGLFLVVVWAVRRGLPKGAGILPREAVEVLGRAALAGKQNVHLVRCGNKLLLVCILPGSVQTLTEISDPEEVERLTELCQSRRGTAASFRNTLEQFAGSQRQGWYLSEQPAEETDFGALDVDAHHSHVRAGLT